MTSVGAPPVLTSSPSTRTAPIASALPSADATPSTARDLGEQAVGHGQDGRLVVEAADSFFGVTTTAVPFVGGR